PPALYRPARAALGAVSCHQRAAARAPVRTNAGPAQCRGVERHAWPVVPGGRSARGRGHHRYGSLSACALRQAGQGEGRMIAATQDPRTQGAASPLLDVRGLRIFFGQPGREVEATRDVTFALHPGERVGLVGESGCGKTVTGLSILGLLPPGSSRLEGSIEFDGRNLLTLSPRELRRIRGDEIGMIFQEPMSALD